MDIFNYLLNVQSEIREKNGNDLEEKYYYLCKKEAGEAHANAIKNVNVQKYMNDIKNSMTQAMSLANNTNARAIYFEYDIDNGWEGNFYICNEYSPLEDEDEDWASEWLDEIAGPSLKEFTELYEKHGFDETESAVCSTLYLLVRTIVAFKEAVKEFNIAIPICIGFHDQDPLIRIIK